MIARVLTSNVECDAVVKEQIKKKYLTPRFIAFVIASALSDSLAADVTYSHCQMAPIIKNRALRSGRRYMKYFVFLSNQTAQFDRNTTIIYTRKLL